MKLNCTFLLSLIIFISFTSSSYAEMTGVVVDAVTEKPIEGAVVAVEWTLTEGLPGMTVTKTYEVFEGLTNKHGKISIPDVSNPFVNPPIVTVYKKGYVAWNNESIFPDFRRRADFKLQDGYVFKLDPFKQEYSYHAHVRFIRSSGRLSSSEKRLTREAIQWEEKKASEESKARTSVKITGKIVDAETTQPIEGAVVFVKGRGIGYTRSEKAVEVLSDKDGKITISGYFNLLVNPPSVTIYKEGYVAWNSKVVFPSLDQRHDFKWQDGYAFRLKRWKKEYYSHEAHIQFIHARTYNAVLDESKLLKDAIKREEEKASEEKQERINQMRK